MISRRIDLHKYRGWILFGSALLILLIAGKYQRVPGYMDAEYYYVTGTGVAFTGKYIEPFLWNYLDNPAGIEHPANTYWMPAATLLSALAAKLLGSNLFAIVRLPFVIVAACIPPLTASLAYRISVGTDTDQRNRRAWMAGTLALFPGYYLTLNGLTETFGLYSLSGTLFLLVVLQYKLFPLPVSEGSEKIPNQIIDYGFLGIIAGLMHLSRADGLLWLAAGLGILTVGMITRMRNRKPWTRQILAGLGLMMLGYLLVMGWWFVRNYQVYGGLLPPGGSLTLWLTSYDQTYAYPAGEILTYNHWRAAGFLSAIQARGTALWMNLLNLLGVQGLVVWLPLIVAGGWKLRKNALVRFGFGMWLVTLFVMTVVFPFSGGRGGYLHSSSALQPLFWVLAIVGLEETIRTCARWRGWNFKQAIRVLGGGLIGLTIIITIGIFWIRVIGSNPQNFIWENDRKTYLRMDVTLMKWQVNQDEIIMVNEPPGFFAAVGRKAVVIPDGDLHTLISVACRYDARNVLVDKDLPVGIKDLYQKPGSREGLQMVENSGEFIYYKVTGCP